MDEQKNFNNMTYCGFEFIFFVVVNFIIIISG